MFVIFKLKFKPELFAPHRLDIKEALDKGSPHEDAHSLVEPAKLHSHPQFDESSA